MAHIDNAVAVEDEHPSFTGTGEYVDAGKTTPAARQSVTSKLATGDTGFFVAIGRDSSGNDVEGFEFFFGTKTSTGVARTTILQSSNSNAAVNWATATKVAVMLTAVPGDVHSPASISTKQNDYNAGALADLLTCEALRITPTASTGLTGMAATYDGHTVTIANASTDFLLWLEHQNTASAAANRFDLPNGFPFWLMPGDRITLRYSAISSRWQTISASSNLGTMGLTEFTDFVGGTVGPFTSTVSGTGALSQASTYLSDTTEKPVGIVQIDTGTTATGRATLGSAATDGIVPTTGAALSVARLAQEAANSGTETYQLISGFADSAGGTFTDGVAWNLRWNGSAQEWSQDRLSNSSATRSTTGSPTPDNNYIWVVVFINPGWTRADFIYSTDSVAFTKADSPTTGIPASTRDTAWVAASMIKSAGTTQRNCSIDLAGNRMDVVRG